MTRVLHTADVSDCRDLRRVSREPIQLRRHRPPDALRTAPEDDAAGLQEALALVDDAIRHTARRGFVLAAEDEDGILLALA